MTKKKSNVAIERLLGRDDSVSFWLKEATHHCNNKGLFNGSLIEVISIIQAALGKEWLDEELKSKQPTVYPKLQKHTLARWILAPGSMAVLSVIELALYLKYLSDVPKVDEVIQMMRLPDQFESSFLQLAHAYRLRAIGASDLEFEPDSMDGRKSDIFFKYGQTQYLAECFIPETITKSQESHGRLIEYTSKRVTAFATQKSKKVIVKVILLNNDLIDDAARKKLEDDCRNLIVAVSFGKMISEKHENWEIQVQELTGLTKGSVEALLTKMDNDASYRVNATEIPEQNVIDVMRGENVEKNYTGHFLLTIPDDFEPIQDQIEKLAAKIEKKVAQLRHCDQNTQGIIIVGSPWGRPDFSQYKQHFQTINERVVGKHKTVSSVILADRVNEENKRWIYYGAFITAGTPPSPTGDLLWQLSKFENDRKIIDCFSD